MKLTAKQEGFAQAIAAGRTQSDAYRSAYDAGGMLPSSIHVNGSKIMASAKVAQRVAALRAELAEKSLWTREQSVAVLLDVIGDGEARGSDKISAVKVLNEMQGFNAPTKVDVTGSVTINVNFD
jgi:hypothetical protein